MVTRCRAGKRAPLPSCRRTGWILSALLLAAGPGCLPTRTATVTPIGDGGPDGDTFGLRLDGETCTDDADCLNSCITTTCGRFDRNTVGPEIWPELQQRLQEAAAAGNSARPDARLLSEDFSGYPNGRYQGAVLAADGLIYATPRGASFILRLDPQTGTSEEVGPDFSDTTDWRRDKWYGGLLAPSGEIILVASDEPQNLRYDPANVANATSLSPVFPEADDNEDGCTVDPDPGCNKWRGAVRAPNGHIIACPRNGAYVLDIDPSVPSAERISHPNIDITREKWNGAVLAPNGMVYCIPFADPQLLEIDPENLTDAGIRRVGPVFSAANYAELAGREGEKWYHGTLAPNGKIYAAPAEAPRVLQIDPEDLSETGTRMVGADVASTVSGYGWGPGALAPDGRIYVPPHAASGILMIDPVLLDLDPDDPDATTTFEVTPTALTAEPGSKYYGTALAPNGKIYAFPWFQIGAILEIDPHANGTFDLEVLLNGHLNGQ